MLKLVSLIIIIVSSSDAFDQSKISLAINQVLKHKAETRIDIITFDHYKYKVFNELIADIYKQHSNKFSFRIFDWPKVKFRQLNETSILLLSSHKFLKLLVDVKFSLSHVDSLNITQRNRHIIYFKDENRVDESIFKMKALLKAHFDNFISL